jgi:poly(hydroxyalkanoate) depolymerase family esterase
MQSLAAVLDDVRTGRRPPWPCRPDPLHFHSVHPPWQFQARGLAEVTSFGSNPGNLRMLKFVPRGLRGSAPLVVLLHGCGQTAQDIDHGTGWSTLANERGFALLVPEQRPSNNGQRGFNWFRPGDVRRGRGEALSIRQMVQRMIDDHGLDRARIYVTGLSAGGAMTSALLAAYPEMFAGGAVIAGLPFGVASNLWGALAAMKGDITRSASELGDRVRAASRNRGRWPKLSIWHGGADKTVAPYNADLIVRQWCDVHGLSEESAVETQISGQSRHVWFNSAGTPVIERILVAGLAHGAPIDAREKTGAAYGAASPFFEDAGISSTYHIARFWGLVSPRGRGHIRARLQDWANANVFIG